MQRVWRSKPSPELIQLMEESVDIKLYLIHEKGPLSFTFQDESKKKYHINIGDKASCSCGGGKKEHCVHTVFVLNRIFKIGFSDPLLYQLNYTDSELSKMVNIRENQNSQKKNKSLKEKHSESEENHSKEEKNRMNLFDDITCSICQEDMYNSEGLFYCTNSCGHNFHMNCLKIWAEHKKSTSDGISCPMCRASWDEEELKKATVKQIAEKINYVNLKPHKGVNCSTCSRINIKCERFHCLLCENVDLCVECFLMNKHNKEHFFIVKNNVEEKWMGVEISHPERREYNIKNIKFSQFLISLLKDYEKITNSEEPDLDDKRCIVCMSDRASQLQLLKLKSLVMCKHVIHFKCSESLFKTHLEKHNYLVEENFNLCKLDKIPIFPGLISLKFKIKQEDSDEKINKGKMKNSTGNIQKMNNKSNPLNDLILINGLNGNGDNNRPKTISLLNNMKRKIGNSHYQPNNISLGLALNIQKVDFDNDNIKAYENRKINELKGFKKNYTLKPAILKRRIVSENKSKSDFKDIIESISIKPMENISPKEEIANTNNNGYTSTVKKVRAVDVRNIQFKMSPININLNL